MNSSKYRNARDIYLVNNGHVYVKKEPYQYRRNAKDSSQILHDETRRDLGPHTHFLEVSSAGDRNMSAMTMPISVNHHNYTVEQLYQYGKVYKNSISQRLCTNAGHNRLVTPLSNYDMYHPSQRFYKSLSAKKLAKQRSKRHGNWLVNFQLNGTKYPLMPPSLFYDSLYLRALSQPQNSKVANKIAKSNAFCDVFSNPRKSVSTQAKSCALYSAMRSRYGLSKTNNIINNYDKFKAVDNQFNHEFKNNKINHTFNLASISQSNKQNIASMARKHPRYTSNMLSKAQSQARSYSRSHDTGFTAINSTKYRPYYRNYNNNTKYQSNYRNNSQSKVHHLCANGITFGVSYKGTAYAYIKAIERGDVKHPNSRAGHYVANNRANFHGHNYIVHNSFVNPYQVNNIMYATFHKPLAPVSYGKIHSLVKSRGNGKNKVTIHHPFVFDATLRRIRNYSNSGSYMGINSVLHRQVQPLDINKQHEVELNAKSNSKNARAKYSSRDASLSAIFDKLNNEHKAKTEEIARNAFNGFKRPGNSGLSR